MLRVVAARAVRGWQQAEAPCVWAMQQRGISSTLAPRDDAGTFALNSATMSQSLQEME